METGSFSAPVESYGSIFVVELMYRDPFNQTTFNAQADAVRMRLYQTKAQQYIAYWYEQLRENSKIEDFRSSL